MESTLFAVTVSRQIGSGGTYIAYQAAKQLGFMFVDREILRRAAARLRTDQRFIEAREERSTSLIDSILRVFASGTPDIAYIPQERPVYDRDLFAAESTIITEIADRHDAVVVGRGGFHVLRNRPRAIHVFIHAPVEFRVERIMQVKHIDIREARALVKEADGRRERFLKDMTGTHWADARNYQLCVDSRAVGFSACVETIIQLVARARTDAEARPL